MTYDEYIQIIEVENPEYNGESNCNNCQGKIYWNKGVINRRTKRLMPLQDPYNPTTGTPPKRHLCMQGGTATGGWVQKYNGIEGLKQTWCEFCGKFFDLSHWSILAHPTKRPYLMCNMEVKICNFWKNYEPLTDGWISAKKQ